MMDIYVIDVGAIKTGIDPEMAAKGDVIQYYSYLIRGCTDNRMIAKEYLDFMNQLIGEYVDIDAYHYHIDCEVDMTPEEYDKTLQEFACAEYIKDLAQSKDSEHWKRADNIHEVQMLIKQNTECGATFISTENMQDYISSYYGDEREILEKILYLFSILNKYIYAMKEPLLSTFRDRLFSFFPRLFGDYYDPFAPIMMDIIYVTMLNVMELKFLG